MKSIIYLCVLLTAATAYELSDILYARIETCRGCSLNRLPQVKQFVFEDAPSYSRVEVKFITGAPPEMVLLGESDKEMDRLPLSQLTRQDCNKLLQEKGFTKKSVNTDL